MEQNLKAIIRYDGATFAGWQIQAEDRTVQGEVERALSQIASVPIRILGAGRTDSGVHALAQVFSFRWPLSRPYDRLANALSGMLGPDILVTGVTPVPPNFHARYSAISKRYAYTLQLARRPDPFAARYAWCIPWRVDLDLLTSLGHALTGTHDFAGFQCAGASAKTTVRTLYSVEVLRGGVMAPLDAQDLWRIEFNGDGFLYKMVRNLTAVMVDIARGKLPQAYLQERLNAPGPFRGHTAPAHGLTLIEVEY